MHITVLNCLTTNKFTTLKNQMSAWKFFKELSLDLNRFWWEKAACALIQINLAQFHCKQQSINHLEMMYVARKLCSFYIGIILIFSLQIWLQGSQSYHSIRSAEQNSGMFGRFRSRHNRTASLNEETLSCRGVDLCTSTIKMDSDDSDLRLCFRIISPSKTYTLQVIYLVFIGFWYNIGVIECFINILFWDIPPILL